MSFEDIQKVTRTEQENRTKKAEAAAEAKRILAEAERAGAQLVERARAEADEKTRAMMAEAEKRAADRSRQILADNDAACEALKQAAKTRLEQAADLIVGRVGNN
jgi:vacuolar-type H+-ATPase subunit H